MSMFGPGEGKPPLREPPMVWITTPCCGWCGRHRERRRWTLICANCDRAWIIESGYSAGRRQVVITEGVRD
ncbi:MAG: hypothetical protein KGK07_13465 [Chloroflexota bacterium]|nr:hypothetical protein [Chloroflexota bacterium]